MLRRIVLGSVLFAVLAVPFVALAHAPSPSDPLPLVNPMVGTDVYNGALYPGAALPFGMVKLSPDTTKPSTAGYNPAEPIIGFSHTHIGGTGGAAIYGQLRVMPQTGVLNLAPTPSPKANETASPGYYAVDLMDDHVHVELTCTERAGFHRYTFPAGTSARILIDPTSVILGEKPLGFCSACSAHFVSEREIEGQTSVHTGYGLSYSVYFVAVFDQSPTARGVWLDYTPRPGVTEVTGTNRQPAGVYAEFTPAAVVNLRVGISYTSIEQARANLEPAKALSFDQVRARAQELWREHLAKIAIEGGSDNQRRQFYTRCTTWCWRPRTSPATTPLGVRSAPAGLLGHSYPLGHVPNDRPSAHSHLSRSRARHHQYAPGDLSKTGWLPDAWIANKRSIAFQGGTHADNVIADAVVKKLGGFDEELAYAAIRKDATEINPKNAKIFPNFGRLPPYLQLGYVPSVTYKAKPGEKDNEWSAGTSRTLEYSYNDFCVSEVADSLGRKDDADKFRRNSLNGFKLFYPEKKLFWGKTEQGEWVPDYDPKTTVMGWTPTYYEGSAWQYRFSMPHDIAGLIKRLGGDSAFISLLDEYFDNNLHDAGNEPGFLTPWLYVYAGRPDKTVDRVREILAKDFSLKPSGYPGDEDVGAMSSWYLFAAMGFYPNAGQDIYLISSPLFTKITLQLGSSAKTFIISAPNLSPQNRHVQSATLNGKPWDQAWFRHADIIDGAELILTMGPHPSVWGTQVRPPSLEH